MIVPIQAIVERDLSAILIFLFLVAGLYEENNYEQPIIWLVAPESMIHGVEFG